MNFVGDLLFDISESRGKAQNLAISIAADVRSIEDSTNSAIETINGYLDVRRGPVDSRGKTTNEFLSEVRQAFEDLQHNAEEKYTQLSTTVDTTVIDDLRHGMPGFELDNMAKGMQKSETEMACRLVVITMAAIKKVVTKYLKETRWRSFSNAGGIIGGALGGLLVFLTVEAISGAMESKTLKKYIEELTQVEHTMREIRKAIANVADRLKFELVCVQLRSGNVGDGREFYFGCVPPLILCSTSSKSMKSIPGSPHTSLHDIWK